jgi:hypothetical protein
VLRARKCAPTFSPFVVVTFRLAIESIKELGVVSHWLLGNYLCFEGSLYFHKFTCVDPLVWWKTYEGKFLNVGFFAKKVLGILGFQIEIEKMFNLGGVLIALR